MEKVSSVIELASDHPQITGGILLAIALVLVYYFWWREPYTAKKKGGDKSILSDNINDEDMEELIKYIHDRQKQATQR